MENKPLELYHGLKGNSRSPMSFIFPEPEPQETVLLSKIADSGKGWEFASMAANGNGKLLSYRTYRITKLTRFIAEPSERVLCLSLLVGEGAKIGYTGEDPVPLSGYRENRVFWQGARTVEYTLPPGEHYHLELYLRPTELAHLCHKNRVMEIIDLSLSGSSGDISGITLLPESIPDDFVLDLLVEVDCMPSAEKFDRLCDCLLLRALGENIEIIAGESKSKETAGDAKQARDGGKRYRPSAYELSLLSELEGLDRKQLLEHFWKHYRKMTEKKEQWEQGEPIAKQLKELFDKILVPAQWALADKYMEIAYNLADRYGGSNLVNSRRQMLSDAIIKACRNVFRLRPFTITELKFFVSWNGFDSMAPLSPAIISYMISLPDPALKKSDGMKVPEQAYDGLAIRRRSRFVYDPMAKKTVEVQQLYVRLMELFVQTMELIEDCGPKGNQLIRELDEAYESGDLFGLLQIEAENLAGTEGYVEGQEEERLRWLIAAVQMKTDSFSVLISDQEDGEDNIGLRLYKKLGSSMDRVHEEIKGRQEAVEKEFAIVAEQLSGLHTDLSNTRAIATAKWLLKQK